MPNSEVVPAAGEVIRTEYYYRNLSVNGDCLQCYWSGSLTNPAVVVGYRLTRRTTQGIFEEEHRNAPETIETILATARRELWEQLNEQHWQNVPDCFGKLTFT